MSAEVELEGAPVSASNWLVRGFGENGPQIAAAADGTGSFGGMQFEDTSGSLDVQGWMSLNINEPDCTAAPRLQTGYIWERSYRRGKYASGAAREIDCDILDQNAVLSVRLITGSDGKRPAETHIERIDWLLGSSYLSGLIEDFGLVDRSTPRPFEEADYRGRYPADVLADIAAPIFRIFFAYYDQVGGAVGLFFDTPTATTFTSTLSISNVAADVDNDTCFAPGQEAELRRSPAEVYAKIRYTYAHGTIIENEPDTVTDFFLANGLGYRGLQVDNSRVGLESTARSMAQRLLTRDGTEHDTITCPVQLPSTHVGLIQAGMRVPVRFSHFPGYTSSTYVRVERLTIQQADMKPDLYDVVLTLSSKGLSGGGGGGAPPPGDFPHAVSPASIVQQSAGRGNRTMASPIAEGDTLVYIGSIRGGAFTNMAAQGYSEVRAQTVNGGGDGVGMFYKVAGASESTTLDFTGFDVAGCWYELPGTWTPDTSDADTGANVNPTTGPITVASNAITLTVAGQGDGGAYDSVAASITFTPGSGWTEDLDTSVVAGHPSVFAAHRFDSGSITGSATNSNFGGMPDSNLDWGMQIASFIGATSNEPPSPGQVVPWTVVTMVGAVGTTAYPYADGSLLVKVDGLLISSASYTETDPAAGTFTLDWIPATDEVVTCSYLGR